MTQHCWYQPACVALLKHLSVRSSPTAGDEASVVLDKVKAGSGNFGLQRQPLANNGDMIEMVNHLDPARSTRSALQAAASVAKPDITPEAMMTEFRRQASHA